jgi:hypothetical protein
MLGDLPLRHAFHKTVVCANLWLAVGGSHGGKDPPSAPQCIIHNNGDVAIVGVMSW